MLNVFDNDRKFLKSETKNIDQTTLTDT